MSCWNKLEMVRKLIESDPSYGVINLPKKRRNEQ